MNTKIRRRCSIVILVNILFKESAVAIVKILNNAGVMHRMAAKGTFFINRKKIVAHRTNRH